ncbi:MAG: hypothetical protein ACKVOR_09045 [Flavobacteriales bacterium]
MKKAILNSILIVLFTVTVQTVHAQCAMCRQTAESASENVNAGIGQGLNTGIVYLMLVPYLLLTTVGVIFFRKKIVTFFSGK